MAVSRYDDVLPGPVPEPAPPRRPGSVRRTSHLDVIRRSTASGQGRFASIAGAARDLLTGASSPSARIVGEARLEVTFDAEGVIDSAAAQPDGVGIERLVGARPGWGYRSGIKELLQDLGSTPLGLLVDDLSGAPSASGYGMLREQMFLGAAATPLPLGPPGTNTQRDVCAGWRAGGVPDRSRVEGTPLPFDAEPPVAPTLQGDDEWAWHRMDVLGARQSRRIRRLDVWTEPGAVRVDAMFRDSTVDPDLTARVVHEYAVTARLHPGTLVVEEIEATPRSLPFPEDCPWAAGSAQLLVGEPAADFRTEVRRRSAGPVSCTHLNDLLRSFGDLPALLVTLDR